MRIWDIFRTADPSKPLDTYVNIEYLTWPIIRYKREVLFGWVDLLVSFGGIAGLFLGFSLLSGVEIIYYFTLRTCCMLYKNRVSNQHWNLISKHISFTNSLILILFFGIQEELYEIEEKKLMKPQEHIDLSLKLMKRTGIKEIEPAPVRRIEVAEIGSRFGNDQTTMINEVSFDNRPLPKHMTRVDKKMLSVQVSKFNLRTFVS